MASVSVSAALPSGDKTTCAQFDYTPGDSLPVGMIMSAPALTADQLGIDNRVEYHLESCEDEKFLQHRTLADRCIVQAGAGGKGAAAAKFSTTLPLNGHLHIRVRAVHDGFGDLSAASMTLELLLSA